MRLKMSHHKANQGFLTFAKNSETVDYLQLAYIQALNIKSTQRYNLYAVVVDNKTNELITDKHRAVFDYIIVADSVGPFDAECQVFWLTPFKETIKLESDLLFTRSIDHWWTTFRLRDIVLSLGCRDYKQNLSDSRRYRKVFDDNELPDVYNGLMYFRYSHTALNFFTQAKQIFEQWANIQNTLINCRDDLASTDLVYAITALIIGKEKCTIPTADFINFVHMKPAINNFNESLKFTEAYVTEFDEGMIRVNNINQYHPFHYYIKDFITTDMENYYDRFRPRNN